MKNLYYPLINYILLESWRFNQLFLKEIQVQIVVTKATHDIMTMASFFFFNIDLIISFINYMIARPSQFVAIKQIYNQIYK
jgi:hypothetical protein